MQLRIIVDYDSEVHAYSAVYPELLGCVSCGDSEQEALANIEEAIRLYLEPDGSDVASSAKVFEVTR
jgi:predicted RNase H-like HicB family nuclease